MPSYRYPPPPMAPRGYGYDPREGDRIIDLIMAGGQNRAQSEASRGALWGEALSSAGAGIGNAILQREEEKKLSRRDSAWLSFVQGGTWQEDPREALAGSVRLWGPERGPVMAQGLLAFRGLSEKGDEEDAKKLGVVLGAADSLSDDVMEQSYPAMRQRALPTLRRLGIPEESLPAAWTPELRQGMTGLGRVLRGEKAVPAESFTLAPGQQRFGANGQPIASVPAAAPEPQQPRVVGRSLVGPDGQVIYRDPEPRGQTDEPLIPVMDPATGRPVLRRRSQAEGLAPASSREQGRAVTSGDAGRVSELTTSLDDVAVLRQTISGNGATGTAAAVGAALPNAITNATGWGVEAKQKQATIDRVKQVIGKALEGGVLRKEDEYKYEKILPTISDPPAVVETKLAGLERAIALRRTRTLESLADAGYDTGRFLDRSPRTLGPLTPGQPAPPLGRSAAPVRVNSQAERDRLPPDTPYIAPDGSVRIR